MVETRANEGRAGKDETHDLNFYNRVMRGFYVGNMPLDNFFRLFMNDGHDEDDTDLGELFKHVNFAKLKECKTEKDMYNVLTEAILAANISDHWEIIVTAEKATDGTKLKPDISIVVLIGDKKSRQCGQTSGVLNEPSSFWRASIVIEVKYDHKADPFSTGYQMTCENSTGSGSHTRGQLARYACEQFAHQHRCHLFQVVIFGQFARFLYWDRAGAIVTQHFSYVENPQTFLKFFWLYNRLSRTQQGWDPTATEATEDAVALYRAAIAFLTTQGDDFEFLRRVYAAPGMVDDWPIYVLTVPDGKKTRRYAVGRYFYREFSPQGRGTRVYLAVNLKQRRAAALKSSWVPLEPEAMSEIEVYQQLKDGGVPNILEPACGGSVRHHDKLQRTRVQDFAECEEEWRYPCGVHWRTFEHRRLVQGWISPVDCLKDSKTFLLAMLDALQSLEKAHQLGFVHGDLSMPNFGWYWKTVGKRKERVGTFFDWEHAFKLARASTAQQQSEGALAQRLFRSTTAGFMSIRLMGMQVSPKPMLQEKPYGKEDDLESVFWAIVYAGLFKFKVEDPIAMFEAECFNSRSSSPLDLHAIRDLRNKKRDSLTDRRLLDLPLASPGFAQLIAELAIGWHTYYHQRDSRGLLTAVSEAEFDHTVDRQSDAHALGAIIRRWLVEGEWTKDGLDGPQVGEDMPANQRDRLILETMANDEWNYDHLPEDHRRKIEQARDTGTLTRAIKRTAIIQLQGADDELDKGLKRDRKDEKENRKKPRRDVDE